MGTSLAINFVGKDVYVIYWVMSWPALSPATVV